MNKLVINLKKTIIFLVITYVWFLLLFYYGEPRDIRAYIEIFALYWIIVTVFISKIIISYFDLNLVRSFYFNEEVFIYIPVAILLFLPVYFEIQYLWVSVYLK